MKVLLACGGTGGHVFPAFAVAEELRRRDPATQLLFACGKLDVENAIFGTVRAERVVAIHSASFAGLRSLADPRFLLKLALGFAQSLRLIAAERPDAVVGFGGYFSFPVLLAAKVLGAVTLLHEQNVLPGLANRCLGRWVDGMALSFEETASLLPLRGVRRVTGNPIRSRMERASRAEALGFFGYSAEKKTILVLGGSQGAASVNSLFLESLAHTSEDFRRGIQVLHLCGRMPPSESEDRCRKNGVACRAFSFYDRMDLAYAAADVALGRAGATFLAEIAFKRIPAILIPYPFGDGHQKRNAEVFARRHEAVIAEQNSLTPSTLAEILESRCRRTAARRPDDAEAVPSEGRAKLADFITEMILSRKESRPCSR